MKQLKIKGYRLKTRFENIHDSKDMTDKTEHQFYNTKEEGLECLRQHKQERLRNYNCEIINNMLKVYMSDKTKVYRLKPILDLG